jgi:hypothetical protein
LRSKFGCGIIIYLWSDNEQQYNNYRHFSNASTLCVILAP